MCWIGNEEWELGSGPLAKVYFVSCHEVTIYLQNAVTQVLGPMAQYFNMVGIIETILDEHFYDGLYNKQTAIGMIVSYGVPSDTAHEIIGVVRHMIVSHLNIVLANVPKDRWVNYIVTPYYEIEITDYQDGDQLECNKQLPLTYFEDLDRERKRMEEGRPPANTQRAIIMEQSEGTWIPESMRRFAGLP